MDTLTRPPRFALALIAAFAVVPLATANATTIKVTTEADELDATPDQGCSLREAIRSANTDMAIGGCPAGSSAKNDKVVVPAGIYRITLDGADENDALNGDLDVTGDARIVGAGPDATVIDGNGRLIGQRALEVFGGQVTIEGLSVHDGNSAADGGGISLISGQVTLQNLVVASSHADGVGGGISIAGDFLTAQLDGVIVRDNDADLGCGGVSANRAAAADLGDAEVRGNETPQGGGGICVFNTSSYLDNAIVSGNEAGTDGGGIHMSGSASLHLFRSTISDNDAGDEGGGIYQELAESRLWESTLVGNRAAAGGAVYFQDLYRTELLNSTFSRNHAAGSGGAILVESSLDALTINNATIYRNVADDDTNGTGDGGGLRRDLGTVNVSNSILAGNVDRGGTAPDCSGAPTSTGYNLVGATDNCSLAATTGDQTGTIAAPLDPVLGPLTDNGGATFTHPLLPDSPALDAGNSAPPGAGACELGDQRLAPRPDGGCDIGAYERVTCMGAVVTEVGTFGADRLRGTDAPEAFLTLDGDDSVNAGGGDDHVCAGNDDDTLKGGAGDDRLDGGSGRDRCAGGPGHDRAKRCEKTS